jgi:Cellulose binding domain
MATFGRGFSRTFGLGVSIAVLYAAASCAQAEELTLDPGFWQPVFGAGGSTLAGGDGTTGSAGVGGRGSSVTGTSAGSGGTSATGSSTSGGGTSAGTGSTGTASGTTGAGGATGSGAGGASGSRGTGGAPDAGVVTGTGGRGGAGGVAGSAGRPATDGAAGTRSVDAATCSSGCTLQVQYQNATSPPEPTTATMRIRVDVFNNGTTAVSLANMTIRYWFTDPGGSGDKATCYYAQDGCATLTTKFVPIVPARAGADRYVEIGFASAAILAPGGHTGTISIGVQHVAGGPAYDQTNDYSYGENQADFVAWPAVTAYVGGALSWGKEP